MDDSGGGMVLKNNHGVALLITVSIMLVLVTVGLEMNRKTRTSTLTAGAVQNRRQMRYMAESATNLAMAVLRSDARQSRTDSVQELWADEKKLNALAASLGCDTGDIHIEITDEMGKIQINALLKNFPGHEVNMDQYQIWEAFLYAVLSENDAISDMDPSKIVNPLVDWMDSKDADTTTGLSGAESAYYMELDPPYHCPNREISHVKELFLVKGGTKALESDSPTGEDGIASSIHRFLTVHGAVTTGRGRYRFPGKININTASEPVIASLLPFGKRDLAEEIIQYRTARESEQGQFTNDLTVDGWYAHVVNLTQTEEKALKKLTTLSSDIFSIQCEITRHGKTLEMNTTVRRNKNKNGRIEINIIRQTTQL